MIVCGGATQCGEERNDSGMGPSPEDRVLEANDPHCCLTVNNNTPRLPGWRPDRPVNLRERQCSRTLYQPDERKSRRHFCQRLSRRGQGARAYLVRATVAKERRPKACAPLPTASICIHDGGDKMRPSSSSHLLLPGCQAPGNIPSSGAAVLEAGASVSPIRTSMRFNVKHMHYASRANCL
jgi:hypothetical protein